LAFQPGIDGSAILADSVVDAAEQHRRSEALGAQLCEIVSANFGMLPDWAGPCWMETDMKEPLEQVVDLLRTPARKPIEIKDFK
jgi:hypothetical protein